MDLKNQGKLKMFLTVRVLLLSNPAITAQMPNFEEFITVLDDAIAQIQSSDEQDVQRSKGITINKKALRESVIAQTLENAAKIQAYAIYIGDAVLIAETRYTRTKLNALTELKLISNAKSLYTLIQKNLANVAPYYLNESTQTNYLTSITNYEQSTPDYRESQIIGKSNSLTESQAFEKADIALTNIDALAEMMRYSEGSFYAAYRNARKIVMQGIGTLQVKGKITDAKTGEPVIDASLSFTLEGESAPTLVKQTSIKGGFMIKTLPRGKYNVSISKIGYITQNIEVVITVDQTCDIVLALTR